MIVSKSKNCNIIRLRRRNVRGTTLPQSPEVAKEEKVKQINGVEYYSEGEAIAFIASHNVCEIWEKMYGSSYIEKNLKLYEIDRDFATGVERENGCKLVTKHYLNEYCNNETRKLLQCATFMEDEKEEIKNFLENDNEYTLIDKGKVHFFLMKLPEFVRSYSKTRGEFTMTYCFFFSDKEDGNEDYSFVRYMTKNLVPSNNCWKNTFNFETKALLKKLLEKEFPGFSN